MWPVAVGAPGSARSASTRTSVRRPRARGPGVAAASGATASRRDGGTLGRPRGGRRAGRRPRHPRRWCVPRGAELGEENVWVVEPSRRGRRRWASSTKVTESGTEARCGHRRDVHRPRRRRRHGRQGAVDAGRPRRRGGGRAAALPVGGPPSSPTARPSPPTRCSSGGAPSVALVTNDGLRGRARDRPPGPAVALRPVRRPARAARAPRAALRRARPPGGRRHRARRRSIDAGGLPSAGAVEAVAVCLLHADLDRRHERAVAAALAARGFDVTRSYGGVAGVPRVRADA